MDIKKELSRYYWINQEVKRQSERLERLRKKQNRIVADTTRGSMQQFPYIERVVKIEGIAEELTAKAERQIDESVKAGIEARIRIENIIARVQDPKARELMRSRFIDCLTWEEVARRNYTSKSRARGIVDESIKKIS